MPVPQRVNFLVEQAGKPVPKQLIENGATSQLKPQLHNQSPDGAPTKENPEPAEAGFVCVAAT